MAKSAETGDGIYNMIKTNGPQHRVMTPSVWGMMDGRDEGSEMTNLRSL